MNGYEYFHIRVTSLVSEVTLMLKYSYHKRSYLHTEIFVSVQ